VEDRCIIIGKLHNKLWTGIYTLRGDAIRIISVRCARKKEVTLYQKKKKVAKSNAEFDRRFDAGEDIHDLMDMSQATVIKQGKKVRITLDVAESLVKDIDELRKRIGVDRGALIKIWLHERIKQEKSA